MNREIQEDITIKTIDDLERIEAIFDDRIKTATLAERRIKNEM